MAGTNGTSLPAALGTRVPQLAAWLTQHGVDFLLGGGGQFVQMYLVDRLARRHRIGVPEHPADHGCVSTRRSDADEPRSGRMRWRMTAGAALAAGAIAAAGFLSLNRVSEFLYYQF